MFEDKGDNITRRPCEEVSVQDYLKNLQPEEKKNITKLQTVLPVIAREVLSTSGAIVAVGKSVARETRGKRRKDLDLVVLADKPVKFSDLEAIADRLNTEHSFRITEEQEPYFDNQYGNIPVYSDSITIDRGNNTSIELVPDIGDESAEEKLRAMKGQVSTTGICRDFSVICKF